MENAQNGMKDLKNGMEDQSHTSILTTIYGTQVEGGCDPPEKQHHLPAKHFSINHSPIHNDHSSFTSA